VDPYDGLSMPTEFLGGLSDTMVLTGNACHVVDMYTSLQV
jgi:hypothetical protein